MDSLSPRVAELAGRYRGLGARLLQEAIRIPAEYVDRPVERGGDPSCGLSNHEGPRLEYLRRAIVECRAVQKPEDVGFDAFGNLVWVVQDQTDGIPAGDKRIIYMDGHTDTVQALRPQWHDNLNGVIDAYEGALDLAHADRRVLRVMLGYLPPDAEWEHLLFGRGAADQLSGVVAQILATKILLELQAEGSLRGAIVRSYATVAEEDNDGGGALYLMGKVLPGAPAELVPDVVILTEATGDAVKGGLGIYRGQRGRMQIEVGLRGRSCHGSMPSLGLNPLEYGAAILAEAARLGQAGACFLDHPFLGRGTRTASWAALDTPSDCAVPESFRFRFDRRLTVDETAEGALREIAALASIRAARAAGLKVEIGVPRYAERTWRGYPADNPQIYPGWLTPEDHPAVRAAVAAYRGVVTPHVSEPAGGACAGALRREPRVDRWIFSTDGVGYPTPIADRSLDVPEAKQWVVSGQVRHPAMIGVGPGIEQNAHRIGECVDLRELQHAAAVLARFPSLFVQTAARRRRSHQQAACVAAGA